MEAILQDVSAIVTVTAAGINAVSFLGHKLASGTTPTLVKTIFPAFREPIQVTTGRLFNGRDLDPEDKDAAISLLRSLFILQKRRRSIREINYIDVPSLVDTDKHVIALGGPLSNPLNTFILAESSGGGGYPVPFRISPELPGNDFVLRRFDGKEHRRSLRGVTEDWNGVSTTYRPLVDSQNWLTRDFLIVTVIPWIHHEDLQHISFVGLYGPGTMATSLLLKNYGRVLDSIEEQRKDSPFFQSLLCVEDIDHSSSFSSGTRIRHVCTHPLHFD